MRSLSKIRGSLLGGAAGDALGFNVEFLSYDQIVERYGADGILGYDLTNHIALISDDTQMTLFTANALLLGKTRRCMRGVEKPYEGYLPWPTWTGSRPSTASRPTPGTGPAAGSTRCRRCITAAPPAPPA